MYICRRLALTTQYSAAVFLRQSEATIKRALRKLSPVQKGTRKFLERYGEELACVRYDTTRRKRFTTIKLIVDDANWSPPEKRQLVGSRVERQETELQRRIKQAGSKWNAVQRVWEIYYEQALAPGFKARMIKLEVSDSRHPQVANSRHR